MSLRRWVAFSLACAVVGVALSAAGADELKVLETGPAANAVLEGVSDGFFVRFDRPVDHINSRLLVKRGSEVMETLQPRLQSNPNVLFARASTLPPGKYTLHWIVKTIQDANVVEGDVPFSIGSLK
jgi:methionine-rich copper-binding protein CopC